MRTPSWTVALLLPCALALVGCDLQSSDGSDAATEDRRHPHRPDARTLPDAQVSTPDADIGGSTEGTAGEVTCYREGNPTATCGAPDHCCFSNYSSAHNGECRTTACAYGTILCDGPEDCAGGQHCCSHALVDPVEGLQGYLVACQASACCAAPVSYEICQPDGTAAGTCSSGSCVSAYGNNADLPRTMNICE